MCSISYYKKWWKQSLTYLWNNKEAKEKDIVLSAPFDYSPEDSNMIISLWQEDEDRSQITGLFSWTSLGPKPSSGACNEQDKQHPDLAWWKHTEQSYVFLWL